MPLTSVDEAIMGFKPIVVQKAEENQPLQDAQSNTYIESAPVENVSESIKPPDIEIPVENKDLEAKPEVDAYGEPIETKTKVYTQAEVDERINQAVRDRISRLERTHSQNTPQSPVTSPEINANSEESTWEQQLEGIIENTIIKNQKQSQRQQWEFQQQQQQAEFEIKFNSGASKYNDFTEVVTGKPLTPQMVLATRTMEDPAAFIYAASKTQTAELERISKLDDPVVQGFELGKLEERMRRTQKSVSTAPKPIQGIKGDFTDKEVKPLTVDERLRLDNERLMSQRQNFKRR